MNILAAGKVLLMDKVTILYFDDCFLSACRNRLAEKFPNADISEHHFDEIGVSSNSSIEGSIVIVANEFPEPHIYSKMKKIAVRFQSGQIWYFNANLKFKQINKRFLGVYLVEKFLYSIPEISFILSGGLVYMYFCLLLPFCMIADYIHKRKRRRTHNCKYHISYFARSHEWLGLRRRPQHLIRIAAKEAPCVFFEKRLNIVELCKNPISVITDESLRKRIFRLCKAGQWFDEVFCIPLFYINTSGKNFMLYTFSQWVTAKITGIIYFRIGIRSERHLVFHADVNLPGIFLDYIPKAGSIYNCLDDYASYPMYGNNADRIVVSCRDEKHCSSSDIVITVSKDLTRKRRPFNERCYTVKNGVDVDFIQKQIKESKSDKVWKPDKYPTIGYIGGIRYHESDKVDHDLLCRIVRKRPEWNWVFIGPDYGMEQSPIYHLENTDFLGFISYDHLPEYYRDVDVWILPYNINKLTDNMSPLKLYDYLATGKPIVATMMKQIMPFVEVIYAAENENEFLTGIELALSEGYSKERADKRICFARENSWLNRYQEIKSILELNL